MAGPTYTYTSNTPQSPNPMNGTQPLILANFQAINELINVNHVGFNTSNLGKHSFISMPFPSTVTTPAATDVNMFTASTPLGPNLAEIFFENSTGIINQISAVQPGGGTPTGTSGTGWCKFTTSGLIMKWGTGTVTTTGTAYPGNIYPAGASAVFTYPTGGGIPPFTIASGYIKVTPTALPSSTLNYGSVAVFNKSTSKLSFQILTTIPVNLSFNWFAIGA